MEKLNRILYLGFIFLPLITFLSCHQEEDIAANDPFQDLYSQEITERSSGAPIECGTRYPFPVFAKSKISLLECNSRGDFSVVTVGTDEYPEGVDIFYYVLEIKYTSGYEVCSSVAKYDPSITLAAGAIYGIDEYYVTRYMGYESTRGRGVRWLKSNRLLINCQ